MPNDIWLNENEYPDDSDVERFGDDSPPDYDPLTIGYIRDNKPSFWTVRRIIIVVVGLILIAVLLLPVLSPVLS